MRVGIIGGGILGLTAAYKLLQKGHEVELFESQPELGGLASTFPIAGTRVEKYYKHIFRTDTDLQELLKELELGDRLEWLRSKMGIFYGGKVYRFGTPRDLLAFSPLSFVDRLRFGLIILYLQRLKEWHKLEAITAEDWMLKYAGRRIYDVVWGPLLRGKFGDKASEISMAWFWNKVHIRASSRAKGMQEERLGYIRGSFQILVDKLEETIRAAGGHLLPSTKVQRITIEGDQAKGLEVENERGEKSRHDFDSILVTIPSPLIPRIAPDLPADYAEKLLAGRYQGVVCLVLILRQTVSEIYWMNIADMTMPFLAAIEQTNFISTDVYGGHHLLYLSKYVDPASPLMKMPAEQIFAEWTSQLRRVNPDFSENWVEDYQLFRDYGAQPIITTHYSSKILPHRTPIASLYLANMTQIYPEDRGTNYSIRLARVVTGQMLEDIEKGLIRPTDTAVPRVP